MTRDQNPGDDSQHAFSPFLHSIHCSGGIFCPNHPIATVGSLYTAVPRVDRVLNVMARLVLTLAPFIGRDATSNQCFTSRSMSTQWAGVGGGAVPRTLARLQAETERGRESDGKCAIRLQRRRRRGPTHRWPDFRQAWESLRHHNRRRPSGSWHRFRADSPDQRKLERESDPPFHGRRRWKCAN
jgi:hypothetical protein